MVYPWSASRNGLLDRFADPAQEADAVGAVDHPVIVGQRQRQHEARREAAGRLVVDRLHPRARDAEDRDFRRVDDRREVGAADAAEVGDAEAAALHFLERDLAAARLLRQLRELHRQLHDVLLIRVADDRHEQPAIGVHGDADVDVFLDDDFVGRQVDRRVELREHPQRGGDHLDGNRGHRQVAAGGLDLLRVFLAELFEAGDVGEIALRDVRNRRPGRAQVLRRLAPDGAHRLPLDAAPAREIGKRHAGGGAAAAGAAGDQPLHVRFHVLDRDTAVRSGALALR